MGFWPEDLFSVWDIFSFFSPFVVIVLTIMLYCTVRRISLLSIYICIQGVPGGKDLTSGECSLGQTTPI